MSEKLPEGWFGINDEAWNRSDRASAVVRCYGRDDWQGMVHGPPRMTQEEAERDRLNMIAGLEGRDAHSEIDRLRLTVSMRTADVQRLERQVSELETRRAGDRAGHAALILEIGKALNANPTTWGFPPGCVPEEFPRFIRERGRMLQYALSERDYLRREVAALKEERDLGVGGMNQMEYQRDAALAKVADLTAEVKTLTEAREYLERNIGELEERRDADEAHVADLELALSEARLGHEAAEKALADKTRNLRTALSAIQRLRVERDNLRHTIATQQTRIDGLTAAACDVAPQLLRDSMRVTQEENARLRAEVSELSAKVITSEAYIARHNDANARTVQERNTCMERMDALRADLAKMSESYVIIKGERDALLKERPSNRLAGVFAMQDRLVEADENAERLTAEIATITTRATAAEGYAQHLLAALNAVSGFKGMP